MNWLALTLLSAIEGLKGNLGTVRILSIGGRALYCAGDQVPEGALAVDPGRGPTVAR